VSQLRRLVVEADGGSRGNPGVAGYGALVRDPESGAVLVERAAPLGIASNNVAEYEGLIAGLEAARDLVDGPDVDVRMDSKLVVEQMSGRWRIKHEDMRRLAGRARAVLDEIERAGGSVTFAWVPRGENAAADALSNLGMDGETVERTGLDPTVPGEIASEGNAPRPSASGSAATPGHGAATRVLLVRPGATDFTESGRLDGRGGADRPLTSAGRQQAEAAARAAALLVGRGPTRVVTSSLRRSVETGEVVAAAVGVEPEVDADWDEQGFGEWEGRSSVGLDVDPETLERFRVDPTFGPPGGERNDAVAGRVLAGLGRLVSVGGTWVVVAHRLPILVVLSDVLGLAPGRARRLAVTPGSLTAVEFFRDGEALVSFVNRT
jgi:broad specificity phosphatase PhoE/ribonuclease HI